MKDALLRVFCVAILACYILAGCSKKADTTSTPGQSSTIGQSQSESLATSGTTSKDRGTGTDSTATKSLNHTSSKTGSKPGTTSSGIAPTTSTRDIPDVNRHNIRDISLNRNTAYKYELIEATFKLDSDSNNPFDPEEIQVEAVITTPKGNKLTVPCFITSDMAELKISKWTSYYDQFAFLEEGKEVWKMRFSYNEIGTYKWEITVKDKNGTSKVKGPDFSVKSGGSGNSMWSKGPVEISPDNKGYFRYRDSRKDYIPVGYALPWSWPEDMADYRKNIKNLSSSGGNITRIWGAGIPQTLALETKVTGVGRYQINHANAQDKLFELMRENNITVQYSFDSFTSLQSDPRWYGEWQNNPYNINNGGFLNRSTDFFTNAKAKKFFKNRIRYTLARWGWDVNITLFELWNEIDGVDNFYSNINTVSKWVDEMCKYIKSIDIYKRPISISYANPNGHPAIDSLASIDFLTVHFYGDHDMPAGMANYIGNLANNYEKPCFVGEFGPVDADFSKCYNGIYLQEGIWSSIAVGSAISAQSWWWDEVINQQGAYQRLKPLRKFVDSFEFSKEPLYNLDLTINNSKIKGYGQINKSNDRGFFWIHNKDNGWYEIYKNGRNGTLSPAINNVKVTIPVKNGKYLVKHWDTWDADKKPAEYTLTATGGKITIDVGSLQLDTAFSFEIIK